MPCHAAACLLFCCACLPTGGQRSRIIAALFIGGGASGVAASGKNMLDIQQLRADLDGVAAALAKRGKPIDFTAFSVLEAERKTLQTRTQELQAQRNTLSKQIGQLKSQGQDASAV